MTTGDERPILSVVISCYNEADGIEHLSRVLEPVLAGMDGGRHEILLIDDGSGDETFQRLKAWRAANPSVHIVRLSRNFGKEAAMSCGLHFARGRAVILLDADLQDPPALIPEMVEKWRAGADMVLARRRSCREDGWFRRMAAAVFYRVMSILAKDAVPAYVGDFRLMDRRVVDALLHLPEKTRFLRGLMSHVGFRTATIEFERPGRYSGHSRWSISRLWNLALEAVTSLSTTPLKAWTYLGLLFAAIGLACAVWIITRGLLYGADVPGHASLALLILILGGLQLVSIGIIGEYLARVFIESKNRPLYVVEAMEGFDPDWVESRSSRVIGNIVLPRNISD